MPPNKRLLIFILCFTIFYTSIIFFTSPRPSAPPPEVWIGEDNPLETGTTADNTDHFTIPPTEDPQEPTPEEPETAQPFPPNSVDAGEEGRLSPHFMRSEFACDCAGYCDGFPVEMDSNFIEKLQELRDRAGVPIIITSGVRCPTRNAEVGGVPYSFHLRGLAADLYSPQMSPGDLLLIARDIGLNTIAYYHHGYIHVELV